MISLAGAVRSCDTRPEAALILSDAPDVISCIYNRGNTSFGAPRTGRLQSARMEWRLSRIITNSTASGSFAPLLERRGIRMLNYQN
jgi:hypothetical protein